MKAGVATLGAYLLSAVLAAAIGWRLWDGYRRIAEPAADIPGRPPVNPSAPSPDHIDLDAVADWHLFGNPVREPARKPEPKVVDAPATRLNLQLLGVLSSEDSTDARAIIGTPGQPEKQYGIGDELPGGAELAAIRRDHVLLDRNGRYEKLALIRDESDASTSPGGDNAPAGGFLRRPLRSRGPSP